MMLELVDDNMFIVAERCTCGWYPGGGCGECYQGYIQGDCIDLNPLLTSLAVAGALCASYWSGWFGRSCDATPGAFSRVEYWWPGCGREAKP